MELGGSNLARLHWGMMMATHVYVDTELAAIGEQLRDLHAQKAALEKQIYDLEKRQTQRLKLISGLDKLDHFPTRRQATVLTAFKLALDADYDGCAATLSATFALCTEVGADKTNWRSAHGESVAVAFARRLKELEG